MSRVVMLCIEGLNIELLNKWLDELSTFRLLTKNSVRGQIRHVPPSSFPNCWLSVLCGHNPNPVHPWDFYYRDNFSYKENRSYKADIGELNTLYNTLPVRGQRVGLVNMPGTDASFTIPGNFVVPSNSSILQKGDIPTLDTVKQIDNNCFNSTSTLYHGKSCDFVAAFVTGYAQLLDSLYRLEATEQSLEGKRHPEDSRAYYRFLDTKIGELLNDLDEDTAVFVLSTYGLTRLRARININEILISHGDLCLLKRPRSVSAFTSLEVDWRKTKCWSTGFNGSLYINLKGREPKGTVEPKDYEKTLDYLTALMVNIRTRQGDPVQARAWIRNDLYYDLDAASGPDLFFTFDDYASSELVGHEAGTVQSHDLSPEDFNATSNTSGYFFLHGSAVPSSGELGEVALEDFAPTIFELLDILHSGYQRGKSILSYMKRDRTERKPTDTALFHSRLDTLAKDVRGNGSVQENEKKIRSRLDALGY
jgi:predicted AlkP superfamily phosphohydrolase/phosphomutase